MQFQEKQNRNRALMEVLPRMMDHHYKYKRLRTKESNGRKKCFGKIRLSIIKSTKP